MGLGLEKQGTTVHVSQTLGTQELRYKPLGNPLHGENLSSATQAAGATDLLVHSLAYSSIQWSYFITCITLIFTHN